jgi:hypothetical protein
MSDRLTNVVARLRISSLASALLFFGVACAKHEDIQTQELRKKAEKGDADAEVGLGLEYLDGHGVPRDESEAMNWFRKAADQGSPMGRALAQGNHLPDSVKSVLADAERFELMSIDPELPQYTQDASGHWSAAGTNAPEARKYFHGYRVLKTSVVSNPNTRKQLVTALDDAVERSNMMERDLCFNPHHAIRAVRAGKTADFVICFECQTVESYLDGSHAGSAAITRDPASMFDAALEASSDSTDDMEGAEGDNGES